MAGVSATVILAAYTNKDNNIPYTPGKAEAAKKSIKHAPIVTSKLKINTIAKITDTIFAIFMSLNFVKQVTAKKPKENIAKTEDNTQTKL